MRHPHIARLVIHDAADLKPESAILVAQWLRQQAAELTEDRTNYAKRYQSTYYAGRGVGWVDKSKASPKRKR